MAIVTYAVSAEATLQGFRVSDSGTLRADNKRRRCQREAGRANSCWQLGRIGRASSSERTRLYERKGTYAPHLDELSPNFHA